MEQKGLRIKDNNERVEIERFFENNSYYRLSGYLFSFQSRTDPFHSFLPGVTYGNIKNLYYFDHELRLLLMDAISKIEIAIRAQIINQYSVVHKSHWHLNPSLFQPDKHKKILESMKDSLQNNTEAYHYYKTNTSALPPNWTYIENLSFGQLIYLYKNLNALKGPKTNIAKYFGLKTISLMGRWMHSMLIIRNICAHHDRLWNRSIKADVFNQSDLADIISPFIHNVPGNKRKLRLYSSICCIQYLLDIIEPKNDFRNELKILMRKLPEQHLRDMGFAKNWDKEDFWE
ncbi:MAG: Abi family protein [Methanosarcinales archaeon]|nr:Abi family protein [Methanosarcinales archaeon]